MAPTAKNRRYGYEVLKNTMRANSSDPTAVRDIDAAVPRGAPATPQLEDGQYTGDNPEDAIKKTHRSDESN